MPTSLVPQLVACLYYPLPQPPSKNMQRKARYGTENWWVISIPVWSLREMKKQQLSKQKAVWNVPGRNIHCIYGLYGKLGGHVKLIMYTKSESVGWTYPAPQSVRGGLFYFGSLFTLTPIDLVPSQQLICWLRKPARVYIVDHWWWPHCIVWLTLLELNKHPT